MSNKKIKRSLCLVLAMLILLAGCGVNPPAESTNAADNTKNEGDAVKKDSLVFSINGDIATLDPKLTKDTVTFLVLFQMFDPLIREEPDGTLAPGLAEKWEVSEDGMEILFTIRKGVKFHNGDTMTVEDVAYSLNRAIQSSYTTAMTNNMDSAEVVDENTVKLRLKNVYAPILSCLTSSSLGIVSKKAAEEAGEDFARNPVGTGPFKFVEWKNGERIVMERFDDHYRGPAAIKDLTFKIMTDKNTAAIALEKGEIDVLYDPDSADTQSLKDNENIAYYEGASVYYYHILFNTEKGKFSDKKLRQAVSYAIDREALILGGLDGYGVPVECPMPPTVFGYQKDFKNNPYDPAKAKQLMAEAGYPDGFTVKLKCNQSSIYTKPTEVLQEQLRQIGINSEIELMERSTYIQDVTTDCNYEITLYMVSCTIPDADFVVTKRLHSSMIGGGNNFSRVSIPELDKLIEEARTSQDPNVRYELYGKISEMVKEEAPLIPIMSELADIAANKNIKGVYSSSSERHYVYNYSW
ncbi:MAG: hypothetical protein APF77_00920 [Clostridia bacterium BRH_c25]|nr:MAG: hypothetical protein APF77_00920 [Clostridia bacterium BRH_c25]